LDITPTGPTHLFGYPHAERTSTGVHDALVSSALYLSDGEVGAVFIANDIIYVSKGLVARARGRIAAATGVPGEHVMIIATHTHSGPPTTASIASAADEAVEPPDPAYLRQLEDGIVEAAIQAVEEAQPARLGLAIADAIGIGTNRRDPGGPSDLSVPVLVARPTDDEEPLALMCVVSMHPTVLHEDSTLISGDVPGLARRHLQAMVVGAECPVLFCTGPCGNQSPRHVVAANTFAEAERLAAYLAEAIAAATETATDAPAASIVCRQRFVDLPVREFPPVAEAKARLVEVKARLDALRTEGAPRQAVRTAECDWFGAEEAVALAEAAASGSLAEAAAACMPAEIQLIRVGPWSLVGWPGEMFAEFALTVKAKHADAFVVSLAGGELQGYLVTAEAADEGGYEASNGLFASPVSGERLVRHTLRLLDEAD